MVKLSLKCRSGHKKNDYKLNLNQTPIDLYQYFSTRSFPFILLAAVLPSSYYLAPSLLVNDRICMQF